MLFQIEFVFAVVEATIKQFFRYLDEHWTSLWVAFPNPVAMLDVLISFFTGLPGILTAAPFNAMEEMFIDRLRAAKLHNRVMTLENAIRLAFQSHAEVVRNVTFTDSSGIVGWLAGVIGRFLWTLGKRFRFLLDLLGAKSEEQVIQVVLNSLKRRAGLIRVVAMVIGIILAVEWVGFLLWCIGLGLFFVEGSVERLLLFPNRPRVRENKPSTQYRQKRAKSNPRRSKGQI